MCTVFVYLLSLGIISFDSSLLGSVSIIHNICANIMGGLGVRMIVEGAILREILLN